MTSRVQSSGIAALSFTISAAVLGLALTPAVASAAPVTNEIELTAPSDRITETRIVHTSDLDLNSDSGLKVLKSRVDRAIGEVCRGPGTGRVPTLDSECAFGARQGANEQIAALRSSALLASAANGAGAVRTIRVVASR